MFIYLIVNHVTGKYYVGQHKGSNLKQYLQKKFYEADHKLSASSRIYRSMRKHGREVFTIHALLSDVQTRTELNQYERDFITFLKSKTPSMATTSAVAARVFRDHTLKKHAKKSPKHPEKCGSAQRSRKISL